MTRREIGQGIAAARPSRFERRQRVGQARDQVGGGSECGFAEIGGADRERCSSGCCASEARQRLGEARLPARGRGPRSTARSSAATAVRHRGAEPRNGCLSKASSVTGATPPSAASAASRAKSARRRVGERVAAGIVGRDVPARERREHAAGQRAVRRDQRRGLPDVSTASRSATAMASASSSALAASMHERPRVRRSASAAKVGVDQALAPACRSRRRTQRLRDE